MILADHGRKTRGTLEFADGVTISSRRLKQQRELVVCAAGVRDGVDGREENLFGVCRTSRQHENIRERLPGQVVIRVQPHGRRQILDAAVVLFVSTVRETEQPSGLGAMRIPLDSQRGVSDRRPQIASPQRRRSLA